MDAPRKYIKQPLSGSNFGVYADNELRKIETSISSFEALILELQDMAAALEVGTFVFTLTGLTVAVTGTGYYARSGSLVVLFFPGTGGTSNANTFKITGIPVSLRPLQTQGLSPAIMIDNTSTVSVGAAQVFANGDVELRNVVNTVSGWTASGGKSFANLNLAYLLN